MLQATTRARSEGLALPGPTSTGVRSSTRRALSHRVDWMNCTVKATITVKVKATGYTDLTKDDVQEALRVVLEDVELDDGLLDELASWEGDGDVSLGVEVSGVS